MIEIKKNLFIGNQFDYESEVKDRDGWMVIQACKEPYHRQALGYTGRGAPKDHPEYLMATRENRLILNLVDADNPAYFSREVIEAALEFIKRELKAGKKVMVHCNHGQSRSPGIGLLYLAVHDVIPYESYEEAERAFRSIYPPFQPSPGMRGFLQNNWAYFCQPAEK